MVILSRFRLDQSVLVRILQMKEIELKRFFDKIHRIEQQESCWNWIARKNKQGYGQFRWKGKVELAHRVSMMIHNGLIEDGKQVLHRCDNPSCVNPKHLFLGTNADNVKDKMKKGRHRCGPIRGEDRSDSKLNNLLIYEIRKDLEEGILSQIKIAKKFEVSPMTISFIKHRKLWKHI